MEENKEIDRVGSVEQKERALAKAGATRDLLAQKIMLLLNAKKKIEKIVGGQIVVEYEDDLDKIAKGVELLGKALGDFKEFDKAGSVTNNFTFATMVKLASTHITAAEPEKISDVAVDAAFKNRVIDAG